MLRSGGDDVHRCHRILAAIVQGIQLNNWMLRSKLGVLIAGQDVEHATVTGDVVSVQDGVVVGQLRGIALVQKHLPVLILFAVKVVGQVVFVVPLHHRCAQQSVTDVQPPHDVAVYLIQLAVLRQHHRLKGGFCIGIFRRGPSRIFFCAFGGCLLLYLLIRVGLSDGQPALMVQLLQPVLYLAALVGLHRPQSKVEDARQRHRQKEEDQPSSHRS